MTDQEIIAKAEQLAAKAGAKPATAKALQEAGDSYVQTVERHRVELHDALNRKNQADLDHDCACRAGHSLRVLKEQHPKLLANV